VTPTLIEIKDGKLMGRSWFKKNKFPGSTVNCGRVLRNIIKVVCCE
jgi:hypothetical protein